MRKTIGKRWPRHAPRGDYQAMCDICGVIWRRSQLVRKEDGLLYCPDDSGGMDPVELARRQAERAASRQRELPPPDGRMYRREFTAIPGASLPSVAETDLDDLLTEGLEVIVSAGGEPLEAED